MDYSGRVDGTRVGIEPERAEESNRYFFLKLNGENKMENEIKKLSEILKDANEMKGFSGMYPENVMNEIYSDAAWVILALTNLNYRTFYEIERELKPYKLKPYALQPKDHGVNPIASIGMLLRSGFISRYGNGCTGVYMLSTKGKALFEKNIAEEDANVGVKKGSILRFFRYWLSILKKPNDTPATQ